MRKFLENASLVIAALVLSLLGLEVGLRVADGVPIFQKRNFLVARLAALTDPSPAANNRFDPVLGWVPKDYWNPAGPYDPMQPHIGKYGIFLKPGEHQDPPTGAILAIGDSFTVGSDVRTDESWPAYLQRLLHEPVINAAAGGYAIDQIVLRAQSLLDVLKPRLVIIAIVADDIARASFETYGGANKPYFLVKNGALVHMNDPVPPFAKSNDLGPGLTLLGYSYAVDWFAKRTGYTQLGLSHQFRAVSTDEGAVACLLLRDLRHRLDERHIELLVLLQYGGLAVFNYSSIDTFPEYFKKAHGCLTDGSFAYVDLWPELKGTLNSGMDKFKPLWLTYPGMIEGGARLGGWYFGHPSPLGHQLTAQLITKRLEQLGWTAGETSTQAH